VLPPTLTMDADRLLRFKRDNRQDFSAESPPSFGPWPPALERAIAVAPMALGVLGVTALASYLAVALVHLRSTHQVGHVAGTWMAQAAYWAAGTPYPPIGEIDVFGGTRFMPGFIALHAAFVQVTGEALVSGKVLTLTSLLLLLAGIVVALRRSSCPMGVAISLAATVAMTTTGLRAGMTVRGDALAAALAVAAMAVAVHHSGSRAVAAGGVLAGLALLCRQNALWTPAAILIWLLVKHRRPALPFVLFFGGTVVMGLAAVQVASGGRFLDQVAGLSFAGLGTITLPQAILRTLGTAQESLPPVWGLLPFALLAAVVAVSERRLDPYHVALAAASAIAIATLQDFGASDNHLLDCAALSAIVTGRLWVRASDGGQVVLRTAIAVAIGWVGVTAFLLQVRPLLKDTMPIVLGRAEYPTFAATVAVLPTGPVLSEHPAVPLARGELPIIVDAWMVARIAERHPDAVRALLNRIRRKDFTSVLLLYRLDVPDAEAEGWYRYQHFGEAVIKEIRTAYRFQETTRDGLHMYIPRRD